MEEKYLFQSERWNYKKTIKEVKRSLKSINPIKKDIPKLYSFLPLASGVIFIAICLVFAGQAGVFTTIFEDSNNNSIYGSWELIDMQTSRDDNFNQVWTFYENNTLKIETEFKYNTKSLYSEKTNFSEYILDWETTNNLLKIYIDYSDFENEMTFNIVPKYNYKYIKDGTGLKLSFTYLSFDLIMEFKRL